MDRFGRRDWFLARVGCPRARGSFAVPRRLVGVVVGAITVVIAGRGSGDGELRRSLSGLWYCEVDDQTRRPDRRVRGERSPWLGRAVAGSNPVSPIANPPPHGPAGAWSLWAARGDAGVMRADQ